MGRQTKSGENHGNLAGNPEEMSRKGKRPLDKSHQADCNIKNTGIRDHFILNNHFQKGN